MSTTPSPPPAPNAAQLEALYKAGMQVASWHRADPAGPDMFLAVGQLLQALTPLRPLVEHARRARATATHPVAGEGGLPVT